MTVIEVDGVKLDEDKLMRLKPRCPTCRRSETRLILPTANWNVSGRFMLHCYLEGSMKPIDLIPFLDEQGMLDEIKIEE